MLSVENDPKDANLGLLSFLTLSLLLHLCSYSLAAQAPRAFRPPKHVEDEVIVRFKNGVHDYNKTLAHSAVGARRTRVFKIVEGVEIAKLPPGVSVKEAIKLYRQHPDVLYAEPNYVVTTSTVPNDPLFTNLWGLQNTGQSGGTMGADIDAPAAWDITTGSASVVVAVIDTGIDYNHQDLSANMFRNTADCNHNGIDDDGNGYIDDCYGIDTVNNDSDPIDDYNHGTHVAGTIGAAGNNSLGVVGVNWNIKIMPCKFLSAEGFGSTSGAIACLEYVKIMKDRGVNIIATSNSWGGSDFSQALYDAIEAHRQRGILFIAAAGNASSNNDGSLFYPASYDLPNVISVAATNRFDGLAYFSNYGRRTVHLGAPGEEILSSTIGNTYSTFSGTSMATPHVTGVAALLKAQNPARDWKTIKNLILTGGEDSAGLTNTVSGKRLNARGSLTCSNSTLFSRLKPTSSTITGSIGSPIDLAALHVNCGNPNGEIGVTANPGDEIVALLDDGVGPDRAAQDGIYTGQFIPSAQGTFTLTFPDGDIVTVRVQTAPANYSYAPAPYNFRTITGTNLNFGDDYYAPITAPFPILFGDGSYDTLYVSSNGNVNFSSPFTAYFNGSIPTTSINTLVAPFWDDLYSVPVTNQNVFWAVTGTAPNRELVIEWRDVRLYYCLSESAATVKFQIVFFEGRSDILFNYADVVFGGLCAFADGGGSATVGVQVDPAVGIQYGFNTQSLTNNTALLWTLSSQGSILTVNKSGAGAGTVISSPPGIDCGGDCSESYDESSVISLYATPNPGSGFDGWSGGGCTGTGICMVTVDANMSITATFSLETARLTVSKEGTGSGTVTSSPAGIACDPDCVEDYVFGAVVTLSAAPSADSIFSGWSGACSGTGDCASTMSGDQSVTATFSRPYVAVTVPNGGEIWRSGSRQSLRWSANGVAGNVKIEISRDGGASWTALFKTKENDGLETWKVTRPTTTQARIRICSVRSPSICDISDANFTIRAR